MKKLNLKKVVSTINESTKNEISVEEICDKLNIPEHEVIEIFELLIDLDKVIKVKTKRSFDVAKKGFIDYRSLSNKSANIINERAINTRAIIKWIVLFVTLTTSILAIRWYILNY